MEIHNVSLLLYSTNVHLKFWVHEKYYGGIHHVWCSENFDNPPGVRLAPSANPAEILRRLKADIQGKDTGSLKIAQQKLLLNSLALQWFSAGQILEHQKDEILFKIQNAVWEDWKPLLYVIPMPLVQARAKLVPIYQRASSEDEYIVPDLKRHEFDIIEF